MDVTEQVLHDWLLGHKPEGAEEHNPVTCAYCTEKASHQEETVSTEKQMISQEQHEALLASAVEKATATAQAELDAEILRLNEKLEEATTALTERDAEIETLKSEISTRDEAARLEALAAERVELVQAAAHFSKEQIDARRSVWANMSEGDFTAYLEDITAVAKSSGDDKKIPDSKFDGTRATAGEEGVETSAIKALFGLAASGQI